MDSILLGDIYLRFILFFYSIVVLLYNNIYIMLTLIRRFRVFLADAGHHRRGKELLDTEDSDFFRCKQASRKVNHFHHVFITINVYDQYNVIPLRWYRSYIPTLLMYLRYYNLLYTEPVRQYFKTLNPINYNNIIFGANLQPDRARRQ